MKNPTIQEKIKEAQDEITNSIIEQIELSMAKTKIEVKERANRYRRFKANETFNDLKKEVLDN